LPELIEIEEARRLVLAQVVPLGAEPVPLAAACGRVLAEDASAADPVPAFDNSAMDGFAVRSADTRDAGADRPAVLRIAGESRAGRPASARAGTGEAIRIATGAMLPEGADAIVRVEDTRALDGRVEVLAPVEPGADIRRAGEDVQPGAPVIRRGVALGPAELGVLASLGRARVACARRPTVAVITTGDELQEPEEPLRPGGVRNTNAYTIPALVAESGGELGQQGTAADGRLQTREAIAAALEHDVVVICGGVSVGEHDHVRAVLAELGARQVLWGIALRPGKPTWFGPAPAGGLVFGLPGNPVSAMVTFLLLVRPALRALLGAEPGRDRASAVLDRDYAKRPGRAHAVRCRLELRDDGWHARPTGDQGSHILTSMLGADALALIPTASDGVRAGERVEIELLGPRGGGGCAPAEASGSPT
jgi:molybdopterin molybdotransferase